MTRPDLERELLSITDLGVNPSDHAIVARVRSHFWPRLSVGISIVDVIPGETSIDLVLIGGHTLRVTAALDRSAGWIHEPITIHDEEP